MITNKKVFGHKNLQKRAKPGKLSVNDYNCGGKPLSTMSKTAENAIQESDLPVFYGAGTVASERPLRCSFHYNKGTIHVSPRLYELLDVEQYRRVSFIRYRGGLYITRNDNQQTSFWINLHRGFKNRPKNQTIYDKNFVQALLREWGYSLNDIVKVPVASFAVQPDEIGLDSWPYPIYRLLIDQLCKPTKSNKGTGSGTTRAIVTNAFP